MIEREISRSDRFGFQFGVLVVEVPHAVPRGLSRLLPGKTISFHVLEKNIRQYDTVIRSMQRRYYVILPQTDRTGVEVVKERVKSMAEEYRWGSIHIGAAVYPEDGQRADSILNRAVSRAAG